MYKYLDSVTCNFALCVLCFRS